MLPSKTGGSIEPFSTLDDPIRRPDLAVSTNHASKTERRFSTVDSARWLAIAAAVALAVIGLDLLIKRLIEREIGPAASRTRIDVLGSFIELRYALNSGVAFGLFDGNSTIAGVLVGTVIVPLVLVLGLMITRGPLWAVAGGLVLGGAAGNLIDRIGDQHVIDFISVGRWPSFNIADASITVGALILIALSLLDYREATATDEASVQ